MIKLMKQIIIVFLAITLCSASAVTKTAPSVEIRFCPASTVRTYPLESRRELQGLLLQNLAVINHGAAAFKIKAVVLELLQSGKVTDLKQLDASDIQRAADRGAKMQAGGILKEVAFQFCGTNLIPPPVKLAGPNLERDQALLVTSQVFAFNGTRDTLRVRVGDQLKSGDVIGKLGSSGNSTEPHLHFHVCDSDDPLMSAGIPVNFGNVTIQWADVPRPIQSGDVIIAK